MTEEMLDATINTLNEKIAKKLIEIDKCRKRNSLEYCHPITLESRNLYKELETAYKMYKNTVGKRHIQDIPF